ncbi:Hypothetical predicted protein [Paramuricea clavata]|uniref:Uncharacterized protein n=1 Tax=Paramuricea clavata TaxID=317549 RepID=A0A7D9IJK3_PARCT|nr:Hypothetical predicted protein [Paramuricea clavata]
MSKRQQPSRGSMQEFAKSAQNTPNKVRNSENKIPKTSKKAMTSENPEEISKIDELYTMMKSVMAKLEMLDLINERILSVEQNVKSLTKSIEFAHTEVADLKEEMKQRKRTEAKILKENLPKRQETEANKDWDLRTVSRRNREIATEIIPRDEKSKSGKKQRERLVRDKLFINNVEFILDNS